MTPEERAHHSNIAVLCANCHTIVDKDESGYPAELLRGWKRRHRDAIETVLGSPEFDSRDLLREYISSKLEQNLAIHETYGPDGSRLDEARAAQWRRHVVATIVPNNADICRVLSANRRLLTAAERGIVSRYKLHVDEFERRHVLDDFTAGGMRFPKEMHLLLEGGA
ncbi:hypothetical protein GCM10010488_23200 [Oerskovia jenensis]